MKLFVFSRYISVHQADGFAVIAARSKEEAEKILADKFYPKNPDIVTKYDYCRLLLAIEDFPTDPGLLCSDDPLVHSDFKFEKRRCTK